MGSASEWFRSIFLEQFFAAEHLALYVAPKCQHEQATWSPFGSHIVAFTP